MSDEFEVRPMPVEQGGNVISRFGLFHHGDEVGHVQQTIERFEVALGGASFEQTRREWWAAVGFDAREAPFGPFPSKAKALTALRAMVP